MYELPCQNDDVGKDVMEKMFAGIPEKDIKVNAKQLADYDTVIFGGGIYASGMQHLIIYTLARYRRKPR